MLAMVYLCQSGMSLVELLLASVESVRSKWYPHLSSSSSVFSVSSTPTDRTDNEKIWSECIVVKRDRCSCAPAERERHIVEVIPVEEMRLPHTCVD